MKYSAHKVRHGVALVLVLGIIMAVVIIGLGYMARCTIDLAIADNTVVRSRLDQTARSGIEHARGLLLNPQYIAGEYFTGAAGQQIDSASDYYYDITITKQSELNYDIVSDAYLLDAGSKTAESVFNAQLRLHPAVAYYTALYDYLTSNQTFNGDVYGGHGIDNYGAIYGDLTAAGAIGGTGTVTGQKQSNATLTIAAPGLTPAFYQTSYYYNGGGPYGVTILSNGSYDGSFPDASAAMNPAKVYYRSGNLDLKNMNLTINGGTLVVSGDLHLKDSMQLTINPAKNMPALIIGGKLNIDNDFDRLIVNGYAQVGDIIDIHNSLRTRFEVNGSLFVLGAGMDNTSGCTVVINAAPNKAAMKIYTSTTNYTLWSPASGAVYKYIGR